MKISTYTLTTSQQTNTATISTVTQNLTGTTNITFSLSGIDQVQSPVDKIIVTFYDDREVVYSRDLETTTDVKSLSSAVFTQVIHSELIDGCEKQVDFLLHRDDGISDLYTVAFKMYKSILSDYVDINLVKSDFFEVDSNGNNGDTLLLTFEADNPELVGLNYLNLDSNDYNYFGSTENTNTSSCSTVVDFVAKDEIAIIEAYRSHSLIDVSAAGCLDSKFNLKYRTRTGIGTANLPGLGWVEPAIMNSQFMHVTGFLQWHSNDDSSIKDINIPIIDIYGSNLENPYSVYLNNVCTGVGTSLMPVSGGYFFVDLYGLAGCETVNIGTSTLTAYISYNEFQA
tara:strand:+ start:4225 stop:5247 length:1023 start_codon:yes stop_codon:yes gene_type:complete